MEGENKFFAGATHLAIFANVFGFIAVLIVYLSKRKTSPFIAEHAKQAMGYQMVIYLLGMLLGATVMAGFAGGFGLMQTRGINFGPGAAMMGFGWMSFLFGLIQFAVLLYAVIGALHGFTGRSFRYWLIGDKIAKLDR